MIEELIRIKGFDKIELIEPKKQRNKDTLNFKQNYFIFLKDQFHQKVMLNCNLVIYKLKNRQTINSHRAKNLKFFNPISSDLDVLEKINFFKFVN